MMMFILSGRRSDRLHPLGQHGVRCGCRSQHDPPQRAGSDGDAHLSPQPLIPPHCGPGRCRAEDLRQSGQQEHRLGQLRREEEAGAVSRGQPEGDHQHISHTIHLLSGNNHHYNDLVIILINPFLQDQISDWFDSLAECLHWNVRKKQKTLDEDSSNDPYAEISQDL